jgi:hypothetical protein
MKTECTLLLSRYGFYFIFEKSRVLFLVQVPLVMTEVLCVSLSPCTITGIWPQVRNDCLLSQYSRFVIHNHTPIRRYRTHESSNMFEFKLKNFWILVSYVKMDCSVYCYGTWLSWLKTWTWIVWIRLVEFARNIHMSLRDIVRFQYLT